MKVAVVILNYKVKKLTLECVGSVKKSSLKNLKIFVVDNSNEDIHIKDVEVIENLNNGFSGGNNIGIKKALNWGAEYILILNPDTIIDKNAIALLIDGLNKYSAGIVCPKIYFEDGKTIWFAGKDFDRDNVLGKHRGVDQLDQGQFDQDCETEATGAAMMMKREVFEKIGLFDERFFLYLEDSDYSIRAKKAGFKIMYINQAKVFHKNAQSTGLGSSLQDYYFTRNRMLFASKFLPLRTRFALFREALRNIANPIRRLAFWDFLTGNFGKGSFQ